MVYEQNQQTYTVKVENGTLKNGRTSGKYKASTQLYVVAEATSKAGEKFSCWKVGNNVVGYETTYVFRMPSENITLTAEYVPVTAEVEKKATGYIESVKITGENNLSFVSVLSVPDDCKMTKAGVIAIKQDQLAEGNELDINTSGVKKMYTNTSKNKYKTFKYTLTITCLDKDTEWCVRPYLEYKDKNGKTKYILGDMAVTSFNDLV